jgi:hypothetical protein
MSCDPNTVPGFSNAAFENRLDAQHGGDLPHILSLILERERRGSRRHAEILTIRQCIEDLLRDPIAEVFVVWIAAHVHEWKHRDRSFSGSVREIRDERTIWRAGRAKSRCSVRYGGRVVRKFGRQTCCVEISEGSDEAED